MGKWFRSWRLVSWRSAVVAAAALYALVGFFVVPWIVKGQIEQRSLQILKRQATVEKVRCNPFSLSLTIEGFSLPDRPGSILLSWDRAYANAQVSSLFRWAVTLKKLSIENPYVGLRRFDDGAVNVLELIEDLDNGESGSDDRGGLPRTLLRHLQVVDGRIEIEDRARPEPLVWNLGPAEVTLEDISTIPEHEGTNDIVIGLPNGAELTVNGTVVVEPLGLDGRLSAKGVFLAYTWPAIAHLFKFDLTDGMIGVDCAYNIRLEDDGLHLTIDDAGVRITDFGFKAETHDEDLLRVGTLEISGGHVEWPEQRVSADSVLIDGATAFAWIEPDGTPSWNVLVPEESQEVIVEAYQSLEERINATADLKRFELRNASAEFEDQTFSPPVRFMVHEANLVVTDISSGEGTRWPFDASATFAESATGMARGSFGASPVELEVEVGLEGLQLARYQPYLARFAPLELKAGELRIGGTARASRAKGEGATQASFEGGFEVVGLDLDETVTGDKLIGWGDLKVAGINADLEPMSAEIREVDIHNAGLEITVAKDGTINLLEFFSSLSGGEDARGGGAAATSTEGLPPVRILRTRLHNCYGVYTDNTVSAPFRMALTPINGTISDIATDSRGAAKLDIDAEIDSGGLVRVDGGLDPFDYQRFTDLAIDLRNVQLPAVSPMAVKLIGHPIVNGQVALDLDYDIADRYLKAVNHIEADDLELGDKVEGEGQISLPFKLGVSLLKDKEGRITLDVPFEGSFDTPGFGVATAAGAAAKEISTELLKSPFRLLGKIGGGGGDQDLEFVEFAAGTAVLGEQAIDNLGTLAAALAERPTLALSVDASYDPDADRRGLGEAAFREEVQSRGVSEEDFEIAIPTEVLESIYLDRFVAGDLDILRAQHTAAPKQGAETALDEVAYRGAVRDALIASQPIDDAAVAALAPARAEAIRVFLVDQTGLDPTRVTVNPESTVVEPQQQGTAASGSQRWVRCQLELAAE